jgi:hypothetical protein
VSAPTGTGAVATSATRAAVVQWVTCTPLWARATTLVADGDSAAMRRPALLRFNSDSFMDDLARLLQDAPDRLADHLARPVSFRVPPPGAPPGWQPPMSRLKLYQPIHGDFNLVTASLVCRETGLPDHTVRPAEEEEVAFVLRRVETGEGGGETELAWATDPDVAGAKTWLPLLRGMEETIAAGEELFPMFPVTYAARVPVSGDTRRRRLLAGLIPVGSRETFRSAKRFEPFPGGPGASPGGRADDDPRWNEFDVKVIGPIADLQALPPAVSEPGLEEEASALLLLDFADLLRRHLPAVWQALESGTPPAGQRTARLYHLLQSTADPDAALTWRRALLQAAQEWTAIAGESDQAPTLRINLRRSSLVVRLADAGDPPGSASLQGIIRDAVPSPPPPEQGTPGDFPVPKIEPTGQAAYRIRCVYRRPRCAPLPTTHIVSPPTESFAIAPVLDPDAPARQVRIEFPIDTSIKNLRKFRKNVGFVISNQLRGQMNRVTDMKKTINGEVGEEESWDLGVICSFSMSIIMIIALLLMIAFMFVLNIVFFWKAFFRICLPIPVRSKS